mmetsp:Transcript_20403/g.47123  ORF Transcript_20403/g.47123 Transcript_20403/m.47123 type:complete len:201 (-) Transcript_20403:205-807(-)
MIAREPNHTAMMKRNTLTGHLCSVEDMGRCEAKKRALRLADSKVLLSRPSRTLSHLRSKKSPRPSALMQHTPSISSSISRDRCDPAEALSCCGPNATGELSLCPWARSSRHCSMSLPPAGVASLASARREGLGAGDAAARGASSPQHSRSPSAAASALAHTASPSEGWRGCSGTTCTGPEEAGTRGALRGLRTGRASLMR